jgi:chromate transport protein ChrA
MSLTSTNSIPGPVSSMLCNYLGYRITCCIGGFVAAVGLFISSFAPNIFMLYGTFGVLTGKSDIYHPNPKSLKNGTLLAKNVSVPRMPCPSLPKL